MPGNLLQLVNKLREVNDLEPTNGPTGGSNLLQESNKLSPSVSTQLATPTFTLLDGATHAVQTVTINVDPNATATYYTTDGSTPDDTKTLYTGAFTISAAETVKAISIGTGLYSNSATGSVTYTQQAAPTFSPVAGTYTGAQTVTITSVGATEVYYTTDGSTPAPGNETLYEGPITVSATSTVKARATLSGEITSAIGSALYTIMAAAPVFLNSILAIEPAAGGTNSTTGAAGGAASIDTTGATILIAILTSLTAASTVTDSESNSWTYGTTFTATGTNVIMRVGYCINPTTSTVHTFGTNGGNAAVVDVYAFSGAGTWALDTEAGALAAQVGTSVISPSLIPAGANEAIVAGIGSNGSEVTATVSNGFNGGQGVAVGSALPQKLSGTPEVTAAAYLVDSAAVSITTTFTTTPGNSDWMAIAAAFSNT